MISAKNVSLSRGSKTLLDNVSFTIHAGQKIGLVGQNGSGKTSLLMLLLKHIEANSGEIQHNERLTFAHVSQETKPLPCSALDYVLQGHAQYTRLQDQMRDAEMHDHFEKLAEYHSEFADIDGYALPSQAASILYHLGFDEVQQASPVASFSGGWRVRLNLARALFTPSDLLLLDEPTNHLDLNTIIWLEKWLQDYQGSLIVISHDRLFLDHVIDHVMHIHQHNITTYTGNYSQFEAVYSEKLALQEKMFAKQQAKVKHMMRFVNRFGAKASKAKQAQSRLKMIDKMQTVAQVQAESSIEFEFLEPDNIANPVLTLDDLSCGYDECVVLQQIHLQIQQGDRIGLLGRNGAGKSTLIKTLMAELTPLQGGITTAKGLKIGYFAQHQLEYLDPKGSPLAHLREVLSGQSESTLRAYLGRLGFQDDRVFEPLENFSGGEKSRLALALIIYQKPALLLLDEPTNHLDLETRMALMLALQNYSGSLVLVSHDRYLMSCITDKLWLIDDKTVTEYRDSLDDYENLVKQTVSSPFKKAKKSAGQSYQDKKKATNRLAQIERQLAKHQTKVADIEQAMCAEDLYLDENRAQYLALQEDKAKLKQTIEQLEAEWLLLHE